MQQRASVDVDFLSLEDARAASLVDASYPDAPGWQESDFHEFNGHQNQAIFVARRHGSVVGYLAYTVKPRQNEITAVRLLVHGQHRRQGVGSALLEAMLQRARKNPGAVVKMLVRESDLGRQLLLRKHGFTARVIKKHCFTDTSEDGYGFMIELGRQPALMA